MSYSNDHSKGNELRAQFTLWLNTTLKNARKMYFRTQKQKYEEVPFEELPMELRIDPTNRSEERR